VENKRRTKQKNKKVFEIKRCQLPVPDILNIKRIKLNWAAAPKFSL